MNLVQSVYALRKPKRFVNQENMSMKVYPLEPHIYIVKLVFAG